MSQASTNCIVCAGEFNEEELQSVALSKINTTRFKICCDCLEKSDPADDYQEARNIINSYLTFSAQHSFEGAGKILQSRQSDPKT
jgi:hypothetical protein